MKSFSIFLNFADLLSFFIIASTTLIALTKPKILKNKKKYKGLFCPAGPAYIENK